MIPRLAGFLNLQGAIGLAAAALLAFLLGSARIELRHAKMQSTRFERLYRDEVAAHATTVAEVRAASDRALARDALSAARVHREQDGISERTKGEFQDRISNARSRALELRARPTAANREGGGNSKAVPGLPPTADRVIGTTGEDRFPQGSLDPDDALTATEQAIQLESLIAWVEAQARVRPDDSGR